MTHHCSKPYDFIKFITGWQRNILRIHSFIKTAISIDDILDPGPEPLTGLRHGVPSQGLHHLPDLQDAGELGGQISFSMRFFLSQSCVLLLLPARVACALCKGLFSCSYISCARKFTSISRSFRSIKFVELPFISVNGVLIEVSIAHSLIHSMCGVKSEYYPGSCSSLLPECILLIWRVGESPALRLPSRRCVFQLRISPP